MSSARGSATVRLFYVDDSGASQTGFVTYSWVEVGAQDWSACLRRLITWRRALYAAEAIPVEVELHATKFLNGRGEPSQQRAWYADKKDNARRVAEDHLSLLSTLASSGMISLGTVYRQVQSTKHWARDRAEVYQALLEHLDQQLQDRGELGFVIMDGDGSDPAYRRAHRQLKLSSRAIIEDPGFQPAHESQFVQVADLVAYVSYQHLLASPHRTWAHPWFPAYLQAAHRAPPLQV